MTTNELHILMDWYQERHDATMDAIGRLDDRLGRLEEAPRLTAVQVARMERTANRIESAAKWLSPKRIALIGSIPGSGGAVYLANWINHILR